MDNKTVIMSYNNNSNQYGFKVMGTYDTAEEADKAKEEFEKKELELGNNNKFYIAKIGEWTKFEQE